MNLFMDLGQIEVYGNCDNECKIDNAICKMKLSSTTYGVLGCDNKGVQYFGEEKNFSIIM